MNHYRSNKGLYQSILRSWRNTKYKRDARSREVIIETFEFIFQDDAHVFTVETNTKDLSVKYTTTVDPSQHLQLIRFFQTELSDTKLEKIFEQFRKGRRTEYDGSTLYTVVYKTKLYHMELHRGDLYATFGSDIYAELNKYLKR